jgi:hypothetical protein
MIWGAISMQGHTELVSLGGGRMTAVSYITDILDPHVISVLYCCVVLYKINFTFVCFFIHIFQF